MKKWLAVIALCAAAQAQTPTTKQIATQRWFGVRKGLNIAVKPLASGMVFDGESIWVAADFALQRIQPGSATILATYPMPHKESAIAYDGQYLWVASNLSNGVTKVQASDGTIVFQDYIPGTCGLPTALAFDGTNIWMACQKDSSVYQIPAFGPLSFTKYPAFSPQSLAFDGSNLWVGNLNNTITRIDLSGTVPAVTQNEITLPGATWISALCFDGSNLWVAVQGPNTVVRIPIVAQLANHAPLTPSASVSVFGGANSLAFDGTNIWTANLAAQSSSKISPGPNGSLAVATTLMPSFANCVVFDGSDVWVSTWGGYVVKM